MKLNILKNKCKREIKKDTEQKIIIIIAKILKGENYSFNIRGNSPFISSAPQGITFLSVLSFIRRIVFPNFYMEFENYVRFAHYGQIGFCDIKPKLNLIQEASLAKSALCVKGSHFFSLLYLL